MTFDARKTAESLEKDRKRWRELKAACTEAGAAKNLYGGGDFGEALDKLHNAVYVVYKGDKTHQDPSGAKKLEKFRKEARELAGKVAEIAEQYQKRTSKEIEKLEASEKDAPAGLRRALGDAANFLKKQEKSARDTKRMI